MALSLHEDSTEAVWFRGLLVVAFAATVWIPHATSWASLQQARSKCTKALRVSDLRATCLLLHNRVWLHNLQSTEFRTSAHIAFQALSRSSNCVRIKHYRQTSTSPLLFTLYSTNRLSCGSSAATNQRLSCLCLCASHDSPKNQAHSTLNNHF